MAQTEPTWLKHPASGALLIVAHDDTLARCLSEGYLRIPAPGSEATPTPEPASETTLPAATPAPEALAALRAAEVKALQERNAAARKAFGVETPPQGASKASAVRGRVTPA